MGQHICMQVGVLGLQTHTHTQTQTATPIHTDAHTALEKSRGFQSVTEMTSQPASNKNQLNKGVPTSPHFYTSHRIQREN